MDLDKGKKESKKKRKNHEESDQILNLNSNKKKKEKSKSILNLKPKAEKDECTTESILNLNSNEKKEKSEKNEESPLNLTPNKKKKESPNVLNLSANKKRKVEPTENSENMSDLIAESKPDIYATTKEQLFVANLADSVSDKQLREFLKEEANVLEIKRCKGFAFLTVASRADCERLFAMKNKTIAGKELAFQYSGSKPKSNNEKNKKGTKLFIGNVSDDVTDEILTDFVKDCGTVVKIEWGEDPKTKRFKGYGMLTMSSAEECQKVIDKESKMLCGKQLNIQMSGSGGPTICSLCGVDGHISRNCAKNGKKKFQGSENLKLFVGNVSDEAKDEMFHKLFENCGTITNLDWGIERKTGRFKGYVIMSMSSVQECQNVIDMPTKLMCGKKLIVKFQQDAGKELCFNCSNPGHLSRNCPQPRKI